MPNALVPSRPRAGPTCEDVVNDSDNAHTWYDVENMLFRSGISPTHSPAPPVPARMAERDIASVNRILAASLILSQNQAQVQQEVSRLMDDFDDAWLAVQRAAYAFHSNSAALAKCGRRLYELQHHYYRSGRLDMAVAIDPLLEEVDVRMPHIQPAPLATLAGA